MNHTLGPTALIHFTRHKCHGQEFTLAHITNTNAQQTHNNEYRYSRVQTWCPSSAQVVPKHLVVQSTGAIRDG